MVSTAGACHTNSGLGIEAEETWQIPGIADPTKDTKTL